MTDPVNALPVDDTPDPWLPALFEQSLVRLRPTLLRLSEDRFPGLRARHYRLLAMLPDVGERVTRLAEVAGLTKQALAQTLDPLLTDGYVEVTADPQDGRARLVRRTGRGDEVVATARAQLDALEADWAAQVGPERWALARTVLAELSGEAQPSR